MRFRGSTSFITLAVVAAFAVGHVSGRQQNATAESLSIAIAEPKAITAPIAQAELNGDSADLATTTISPERLIDTRPDTESLGGTKEPWEPGEVRTVQAAGLGSVPIDARGVVVNVTAVRATSQTYLTAYPTGSDRPTTATLNSAPGDVAFNSATVVLGPDGTFDIYNFAGTVDIIIDVMAYMTTSLSDAVEGIQTGEVLQEINPPDYQLFWMNGQFNDDDDLGYTDWSPFHSDSLGVTLLKAVEIPPNRYAADAEVKLEALLTGLHPGEELCLRMRSSIEGPLEDSETCISGDTSPAFIQPDAASDIRWYEFETPRVPIPIEGKLYVEAKFSTSQAACDSDPDKCEASLASYNFRVFG